MLRIRVIYGLVHLPFSMFLRPKSVAAKKYFLQFKSIFFAASGPKVLFRGPNVFFLRPKSAAQKYFAELLGKMRWCYSKFDSLFQSHTVGVAIGVGRTHRGFAYGMGRTHGVGRTPSVGRTHGVGRTDGGGRTWWGVAQNALVFH